VDILGAGNLVVVALVVFAILAGIRDLPVNVNLAVIMAD
jgi:hypothetical protein